MYAVLHPIEPQEIGDKVTSVLCHVNLGKRFRAVNQLVDGGDGVYPVSSLLQQRQDSAIVHLPSLQIDETRDYLEVVLHPVMDFFQQFLLFDERPPVSLLDALPLGELYKRELTLTATYSSSPEDLAEAFGLLRSRAVRVDELCSHRVPLDRLPDAVRLMERREALKVFVEVGR